MAKKYTDAEIEAKLLEANKRMEEEHKELREHSHSCDENDDIVLLDITEIVTNSLDKEKENKTETKKSGELKIVVESAKSENSISLPARDSEIKKDKGIDK